MKNNLNDDVLLAYMYSLNKSPYKRDISLEEHLSFLNAEKVEEKKPLKSFKNIFNKFKQEINFEEILKLFQSIKWRVLNFEINKDFLKNIKNYYPLETHNLFQKYEGAIFKSSVIELDEDVDIFSINIEYNNKKYCLEFERNFDNFKIKNT